jgi:hypothetical protein
VSLCPRLRVRLGLHAQGVAFMWVYKARGGTPAKLTATAKQKGEQFTAPRARNDTRVLTPTCRASQVGMFASVSAGSGVVVRVSWPQMLCLCTH